MKRLKSYLLNMDNTTSTYKEMYEGEMIVYFPPKANGDVIEPEIQYDSVYWKDEVAYVVERSHKLALDKPTVTIQIPCNLLGIYDYTETSADHCLRKFKTYIDELNSVNYNVKRPDRENGKYYVYEPGGVVLSRNASYFTVRPQKDYENGKGNAIYLLLENEEKTPQIYLCIMMQIQLPAKKIRKSIQMLCRDLPNAVECFIEQFDLEKLNEALLLSSKQREIRAWLKESEYCVFIANGSILPRSKGTDLPLQEAIPFVSTPRDEIEVCGIRGMGIKKGVTVITGGGYSGKSTLLDAISAGIYNHVKGDGRELVITDESAVKISAEDGRSVKNVNISPFIKWLPSGDTRNFSTEHASGSTSQAANIMEAVHYNMKLLLIDEDKSATNFMIRDQMMKELIEKEPITPFTERVNELYEKNGVSTILVIGGSGEYLSVADKIYKMEDYCIQDVTERAQAICQKAGVILESPCKVEWSYKRLLNPDGFTSYPKNYGTERLEVSDMGFILCGDECIDIRMLYHAVSKAQLNAMGFMLRKLELRVNEDEIDIEKHSDELYDEIEKSGIDCIFTNLFTTCERFLDLPRKHELMAVINRMKKIKFIPYEEECV